MLVVRKNCNITLTLTLTLTLTQLLWLRRKALLLCITLDCICVVGRKDLSILLRSRRRMVYIALYLRAHKSSELAVF